MWRIKQIFDGDYGCEEMTNGRAKVSVTLVDEQGEESFLTVEDAWLLKKGLDEGDCWPYKFFGAEKASIWGDNKEFPGIHTPYDLYDALSKIWCEKTCAPRLRESWTKENMTMGQCSITAFLTQDVFGGKVYGMLRSGGNYHCFNVVGNCKFDLTSEQFGDETLDYENVVEQSREVHLKAEKLERYEYLKACLKEMCLEMNKKQE